jgi:hypothetical protein
MWVIHKILTIGSAVTIRAVPNTPSPARPGSSNIGKYIRAVPMPCSESNK